MVEVVETMLGVVGAVVEVVGCVVEVEDEEAEVAVDVLGSARRKASSNDSDASITHIPLELM